MLQLLLLLVPIAFLLGWFLGQYNASAEGYDMASGNAPTPEYLLGVDYLVKEQPDLALENLIKLIELKPTTSDFYSYLGVLWRRHGELDQASAIHQKLMLEASLAPLAQAKARLELARDFKAAGMLDRADALLRFLVKKRLLVAEALSELVDLYQQQQQWKKALAAANFLKRYDSSAEINEVIAYINCERAVLAAAHPKKQLIHLRRALKAAPDNVRAATLLINYYLASHQHAKAWSKLTQLFEANPRQALTLYPAVKECIKAAKSYLDAWKEMLIKLPLPINCYADVALLQQIFSYDEMAALLFSRLTKDNAALVLYSLGQLYAGTQQTLNAENLDTLYNFAKTFKLELKYRCQDCGLVSKALFWRCPSCSSLKGPKPFLDLSP